jgi:(E)-4-hydroxy-3-methylbut-2-enyl-diphosphate synthase
MVSLPLVADIHFDYRIALRCLDFPIAKIRINPGNIGSPAKVEAVLSKARAKGRPIRIGVNAGSLPQDLRRLVDQGRMESARALAEAAERELEIFRQFDFPDVLVSMKASGIADTIKANRILAEREGACDAGESSGVPENSAEAGSAPPLHIGVTEAGPLIAGVTRSALALGTLLAEGIGDTIRVSLSDTMENEVIAGREILQAVPEIAPFPVPPSRGVRIVSCPRCGRHSFDTHGFTERWLPRLYSLDKDIAVAVMGCVVNGPGEARHADLGITGAGDRVLIFRYGEVIRTIGAEEADKAFAEELESL